MVLGVSLGFFELFYQSHRNNQQKNYNSIPDSLKYTEKVLPIAGILSTSILPPALVIILFTRYKPTPVPSTWSWKRLNIEKSFFCLSSSSPSPLSFIFKTL